MSDLISKELLSLVLDKKITAIGDSKRNLLSYSDQLKNPSINLNNVINLDTLGRLIREYIASEGYIYNLFNSTSVQGYVMIINDNKITGKTELEVCVKSIEFIAKEKGSI